MSGTERNESAMRGILSVAVGFLGLAAAAETLRFEGVLGNSGELDRPVTFGSMARETRGLGAAYDAAGGVLYDRAGSGTLNAYALDGRLLAQFGVGDRADAGGAVPREIHRDPVGLLVIQCGEDTFA